LPFEESMAKKLFYGICHFDLFKIFNQKWQKRANRQLNSSGILFLRSLLLLNCIKTDKKFFNGSGIGHLKYV